MKNSWGKTIANIFVVILGVGSLVTTWYPNISIGKLEISRILTSITVSGIIAIYLYNNSNRFFLWVRRVWASLQNGTVNWRVKYQTGGLDDADVRALQKRLKKHLRNAGSLNHVTPLDESRTQIQIEYTSNNGLKSQYKMTWQDQEDDKKFVVLTQESQTSYKDVQRLWESFVTMQDSVYKTIAEQDNSTLDKTQNKSVYHLSLTLDKNPFYRLTET